MNPTLINQFSGIDWGFARLIAEVQCLLPHSRSSQRSGSVGVSKTCCHYVCEEATISQANQTILLSGDNEYKQYLSAGQ